MAETCEVQRSSDPYKITKIDLHVLLPELPDLRDACVHRLATSIVGKNGIEQVHLDGELLCIHYDSSRIPLAEVERVARSTGAELTSRYGHEIFPVHLMDGEDSGTRIEKSLKSRKGILSASVSLSAQVARVEWDKNVISRGDIQQLVNELGINAPAKVGCCDHGDAPHSHDATWAQKNKELMWSGVCGLLLLIAFLGERYAGLPHLAAIVLYVASYAFGGYDLASHWIKAAIKAKPTFDIDLLMLLAAIGAAILNNWAEGAFLLFLFSFAHALEHYALDRARNAISALSDLAPDTAFVRRDGNDMEIPVDQVKIGESVFVRPGGRVPVDGSVITGTSTINQAPITGESVPVEKAAGDKVFAGTINGEGSLEIRSESAAGERTLDRVIRLVEEAQTQKAPTEQFVERFSARFVPTVMVADLLLIVLPPLFGALTWNESFYRGMALLVAASPCALALGTPSAVLAGIAQAARRGILVKGGAHLENLGNLRAIAFDKTGTLTMGEPEVTDIVPMSGVTETELLTISAAAERQSQHPLAEAIVRRAKGLQLDDIENLQSITGRGIRGQVNGKPIEIGSLRLWEAVDVPAEVTAAVNALTSKGKSVIVTRYDAKWLGIIGVADQPRKNVRQTLDALRKLGIKPLVMLTGDNRGVGDAIGKEVGVDEVKAELLPEDKVTAIRELAAEYKRVAMIGDGINDAPALANATVGIAMGGAGTAVALETADVALMGDDLSKLPFAVGLARQASQVIKQNLAISLIVIAGLVVATTTGYVHIGPAVIFHEGSTLVVLANSLRLLGYRDNN